MEKDQKILSRLLYDKYMREPAYGYGVCGDMADGYCGGATKGRPKKKKVMGKGVYGDMADGYCGGAKRGRPRKMKRHCIQKKKYGTKMRCAKYSPVKRGGAVKMRQRKAQPNEWLDFVRINRKAGESWKNALKRLGPKYKKKK